MKIQLGEKIRALRKAKGLTQEALAEKLSVSAQAVSKWENADSYPDMTMIPILASFFGVSLDTLFNYDAEQLAIKIDSILEEAGKSECFWENPEKCEAILLAALEEHPCNDHLLRELLSLYECQMRGYKRMEYAEKAERTAKKLFAESSDVFMITSAKADLASVYMMQDRYDDAKKLVESLPEWYPRMLNDKIRTSAMVLTGKDRLAGAKVWKSFEIQELYIACEQEGRGSMEVGEYENALAAFVEAQKVLEAFLKREEITPEAYLWAGMQTHHWCIYLGEAGALAKLDRKDEAKAKIEYAFYILSHAWGKAYEESDARFLHAFREEYEWFGLSEVMACPC